MRWIARAVLALAALASRAAAEPAPEDAATAVFAGGCFWCVEADFEKLDGVYEAVSGYTGGFLENPTYEEVSHSDTGHYEAVRVAYDPAVVSYRELIDFFFRHVDPTDPDGQFCDRGPSYRTAIFVAGAEDRETALAAKAEAAAALEREIVTPVLDLGPFWEAEAYHQDYYLKNKIRYAFYRTGCGRDRRIKALWGE